MLFTGFCYTLIDVVPHLKVLLCKAYRDKSQCFFWGDLTAGLGMRLVIVGVKSSWSTHSSILAEVGPDVVLRGPICNAPYKDLLCSAPRLSTPSPSSLLEDRGKSP